MILQKISTERLTIISHCVKRRELSRKRRIRAVFNVRITPELHKAAVIAALRNQTSLNNFAEKAIAAAVGAKE